MKATIFKNRTSQAVRLPVSVRFEEGVKDVEIIKVGKSRVITPADCLWDDFFDMPHLEADFMADRDQPDDQEREGF